MLGGRHRTRRGAWRAGSWARSPPTCRPGWTGCRGRGSTGWWSSGWARCGSSTGSRSPSWGRCRRRSSPEDTGLGLSSFDVGLAGAVYVAGACLGALVFGQLTDRFGRKKLFLITLVLYTIATVLTAFAPNPLWYFVCRFLTGAGIGGEYAAINSAIDELIPAQYRGRIDVVINGSFWVGAAGGALLTIPLLDPTRVDPAIGWRLAFGLGAVLAVGVLLVRRHVPESPRWLFIHGREDEGERIVNDIEDRVTDEGHELAEPDETITIRQRHSIGIAEIAKMVFTHYPRRTILCFALFVGQAFLYNAFFFTYGDTLTTFLEVKQTGWYIAIFAASNFLGALLLSRLFDTVGRVRMIAGTYILSGVLLAIAGLLLGGLNATTLTLFGAIIFFFASAGRQRGLPDGQRDLPDGDPGALHRLLLRDRDRRRRHHRPAAVRRPDRGRVGVEGHHPDRGRLLHRGRADGGRRGGRDLARRQGGAAGAGVHRPAADRRGDRRQPRDGLSLGRDGSGPGC